MPRTINPRKIKPGETMLIYFGQAAPGDEIPQLLLAHGDPDRIAAIAATLPEVASLRYKSVDVPMKLVTRLR